MEYNDEFLKNVKVNVNPDDIENTKNTSLVAEGDDAEEDIEVNSKGVIAYLLESRIENQKDKIENLNDKITARRDKIQRNTDKVAKLTAKISKLEKQNKFLETAVKAFPKSSSLFQAKIKRNIEKISTIRNEKIPKRLEKIEKHNAALNKLEKKVEKRQLKIRTFENIQNYFESFSISDPEQRHDNFISCLKAMNDSASFKAQNKIERYTQRITSIERKVQFLNKGNLNPNVSTREWIDNTLKKYESRISALEEKISKQHSKLDQYNQLGSGMSDILSGTPEKRSVQIEEVMKENGKELQVFLETLVGSASSIAIADRILTFNSHAIRNALDLSKINDKSNVRESETNFKNSLNTAFTNYHGYEHHRQEQKKPSLLNKLKENEHTAKQLTEAHQKSFSKEKLAISQ